MASLSEDSGAVTEILTVREEWKRQNLIPRVDSILEVESIFLLLA